jgi:hypothetical protein
MEPRPEPLPAVEEQAEEGRLEEEGEHAFHGQRLADDPSGEVAEPGPVGPELELERDPGDHADGEVHAEDAGPEARSLVVERAPGPVRLQLEEEDEERQPHRQLGEQVVVGDGEAEVQAMPEQRVGHRSDLSGKSLRRNRFSRRVAARATGEPRCPAYGQPALGDVARTPREHFKVPTLAGRAELRSIAPEEAPMPDPLSPEELRLIDAWWRAANYLTVGQIYLQENPLLREPLRPEHIKPRLLGHWGTSPGSA